ncbi:hypothetical protein EVJ58_g5358 [Rhodofomes roseus]|uniref:Uncharacterized protein n=1 Tax=Rhodofomes roseus TaxID=34475 RepID=A0A4Y9YDL5_9APHY|nr:hypothetical protein EVJ58_g5358 [Rhodofomes roseus]
MQYARKDCVQKLIRTRYALRNKASLNRATVLSRPFLGQYSAYSTNSDDSGKLNFQTGQTKREGNDHSSAYMEGPRLGGRTTAKIQDVEKEFTEEIEKILSDVLDRQQDGAVPEPPATPPPSSHLDPPPRTRAPPLNRKDARLVESLASGLLGESSSSQSGGERDPRSFTVTDALPPLPDVPSESREILTDELIQMYLDPLYSRGWHVNTKPHRNGSQNVLTKVGSFKHEVLVSKFVMEVLSACHRESVCIAMHVPL